MDYKPKIKLTQEEFRVLASDTRIDILKLLDESQYTVSDISRKLDMNKATVHEHLTKLMEVGLVKKDDSPRKWVYYRLTWKGRNLLHPERVRVMVSLGIMLAVVVLGVLLVAAGTDFITPGEPNEPPVVPADSTVHIYWAQQASAPGIYDIGIKGSTAVTITEVEDLRCYIEEGPTTITKRESMDLNWAWESDVIHLYDPEGDVAQHEGKYLYVEGSLMDDRNIQRPFGLRRYIVPQGMDVDLRIAPIGVGIDIANLSTNGQVGITFEVENLGSVDVNSTLVEVFSVRPTFRATGFPSYGSPYLKEIFNTTVSVPVNGSVRVTFQRMASELFMRGILVVVDPVNELPGDPLDNNQVTQDVPEEVRTVNEESGLGLADEPQEEEEGLGLMAVAVVVLIMVVLIAVAVVLLRQT